MQDESTGVPKIGYAMIMSLYSTSVPLHLSKNTTYMSSIHTRPANWSHTLGCVSPSTCTKQLGKFARGNLTGWDIQNCAIAVGLECGEDALEISGTVSCAFHYQFVSIYIYITNHYRSTQSNSFLFYILSRINAHNIFQNK